MAKNKKQIEVVETKKVQRSFTLKKSVDERFMNYCTDNFINKSQLLESIIIAYFESKDFAGMERRV